MRVAPALRLGAVAAAFTRDLDFDLVRVETIVRHARQQAVQLLVLPAAALGGHLADLARPDPGQLPPALGSDHRAVRAVARMAGDMVVCVGYCEADGGLRYNAAAAVTGDGVLGRHRKVCLPPGEATVYAAGSRFGAFDTPVGRLGMLIDDDKATPEGARALVADGAQVLACLSAWPTRVTSRPARMADDHQSRLFDLYDRSRAAENQVVLASSNLTGAVGGLRFLGQAKVVDPGGDVVARSWGKAGLAVVTLDVPAEIDLARRAAHHLDAGLTSVRRRH
jgi:predicted amidohydrolase